MVTAQHTLEKIASSVKWVPVTSYNLEKNQCFLVNKPKQKKVSEKALIFS